MLRTTSIIALSFSLLVGCARTPEMNVGDTDANEASMRQIFKGANLAKSQHAGVGAVILMDAQNNASGVCTGTLIGPNIVLTAAHCVAAVPLNGSMAFTLEKELKPGIAAVPVLSFLVNSEYHPLSGLVGIYDSAADVALLKLNSKLHDVTPHDIAAILPDLDKAPFKAKIVGYGFNDSEVQDEFYNLPIPELNTVLHIILPVLTDVGLGRKRGGEVRITNLADGVGNGNSDHPITVAAKDFLVAPVPNFKSSQRTCKGDSGGPALYYTGGRYQIVGITSGGFGDNCATGTLDYYTNMVKYKSWAEEGSTVLNPIKGSCTTEDQKFQSTDGGCKETNGLVVWSFTSRDRMNQAKAIKYCDDLNESGKSDWRLPTVAELKNLAADGVAHIDIEPFQVNHSMWASQAGKVVYNVSGHDYQVSVHSDRYVACVRK